MILNMATVCGSQEVDSNSCLAFPYILFAPFCEQNIFDVQNFLSRFVPGNLSLICLQCPWLTKTRDIGPSIRTLCLCKAFLAQAQGGVWLARLGTQGWPTDVVGEVAESDVFFSSWMLLSRVPLKTLKFFQ